jgi:succinate-acetate transporter protein
MSAVQTSRRPALAGADGSTNGWATRVFLQPIAAPSVLGLAGFSVATLMVATIQAKWWGSPTDFRGVAPFCLTFGGIAQFLAGMWAYKARDVVATLAHGAWGAFWIAFFVLQLLQANGTLPTPATGSPDIVFGMWMVGLAYITMTAALGAMLENGAVFLVLASLATGASLSAAGFITGGFDSGWTTAGGWAFVVSAGLAWYVVTAMTLHGIAGKEILPTFPMKKPRIGARTEPIEIPWAEPGIKHGQS